MEFHWHLRHVKQEGLSTTVTLLCDAGRKMHTITFRDRGRVTLHDHSRKSEEAAKGLAEMMGSEGYRLPLCMRVLADWKAGNFWTLPEASRNKAQGQLHWRNCVNSARKQNKVFDDADLMNYPNGVRLRSIIDAKQRKLREMSDKLLHGIGWQYTHIPCMWPVEKIVVGLAHKPVVKPSKPSPQVTSEPKPIEEYLYRDRRKHKDLVSI